MFVPDGCVHHRYASLETHLIPHSRDSLKHLHVPGEAATTSHDIELEIQPLVEVVGVLQKLTGQLRVVLKGHLDVISAAGQLVVEGRPSAYSQAIIELLVQRLTVNGMTQGQPHPGVL